MVLFKNISAAVNKYSVNNFFHTVECFVHKEQIKEKISYKIKKNLKSETNLILMQMLF